ncbi:hypothetical protein L596_007675 [Steinernema carpocapsae]|uniref:Ig-like domain-containing protein n=1 Tax=Steinernema carpocapsae TaxID=34508 RepID=A0A4U5PAN4_STECR|nr:hypothetical protein L596_007675 [Steinernema carpocapsae]
MAALTRLLALSLLLISIRPASAVDAAFTTQPEEEPYYVAEGEQGPLLTCSFEKEYRDRNKYEHFWSRVRDGTPRFISRNEDCFIPTNISWRTTRIRVPTT